MSVGLPAARPRPRGAQPWLSARSIAAGSGGRWEDQAPPSSTISVASH